MKSEGPAQPEVQAWLEACFGTGAACSLGERTKRFLEEALEAVQSAGMTCEEAHQLVDYVFGRAAEPDISRELGGVLVTALVLSEAAGHDLYRCGAEEFSRCLRRVDEIRAKQLAKPPAVKDT